MQKIRVKTPATSANLGPGFDCLGLALGLYNTIDIDTTAQTLHVEISGTGAEQLPKTLDNLTLQAMSVVYDTMGLPLPPMSIKMDNRIPLSSGLGSSAAAIVGGIVAANALLGEPLSGDALLEIAVEIEQHPDNVTPALMGGLTISSLNDSSLLYRRVDVPPLTAVVAMPRIFVSTAAQRAALPTTIPYRDAVLNIGHVALVVKALADGDIDLLCHAVQDRVHVPYRRGAIPGYDEVEAAAKSEGAAVTISGAGPSVIAFTHGNHEELGQLMVDTFEEHGDAKADYWILPVDRHGAQIAVQ